MHAYELKALLIIEETFYSPSTNKWENERAAESDSISKKSRIILLVDSR